MQSHSAQLAQAQQVYLVGNQLPQRWAGQPNFVLLQSHFGLGHAFLATWRAWQQDPSRCDRLHVVALAHRPPTQADLARLHADSPLPQLVKALVAALPVLTPNLHALSFEGGRVQLLLAFGKPGALLRELRCSVDAFFLAPDLLGLDSRFIQALARRAAPGATVASASVEPVLHQHLVSAGFVVRTSTPFTTAIWAPRFTPRGQAMPRPRAPADALVVGAGLAGASVAHALRQRGWQLQVWDQNERPAQGASGNPAGIFHGSLHAQDGPHARLLRAAALHASRCLQPLLHSGAVIGQAQGLLRLSSSALPAMQALLQSQGLPAEYVSALSADAASQQAGVALPGPAWLYPGGGWLAPASLVQHWLADVDFVGQRRVAALRAGPAGWQALNEAGNVLGQAQVVVLANAEDAQRLLAPWGAATLPLRRWRGQVSCFDMTPGAPTLRLPVAGDGYALALPDGSLLCGASAAEDDDELGLRAADHAVNLQRLARLCGLRPPDGEIVSGRVGWRVQSDDRLPIAGPVPGSTVAGVKATDQARRLPRTDGLFVCSALGGRGITWAPLMGELLAAQISGTPLPLEQSLVDAIDPGRWRVRAVRRAGRDGPD